MQPHLLSRRRFLAWPGAAVAGAAFAGCVVASDDQVLRRPFDPGGSGDQPARLRSRPAAPAPGEPPVGLQVLGPEAETDALVYVPSGYRPDAPVPLVLMLHGAGGMAERALDPFLGLADGAGVLLVAPQSRDRTWDAILGQYGPDVARIDRALEQVMGRYAVDGARVAVEGFSDGASYALGLGLANGDLFSSVIAFSPGFEPPACRVGKPRVFVSHGVADTVLPIDRCSRRIVPHLRNEGYDVRYEEFDGGHEIPPSIVSAAWEWLPAGG